MVFVKSVVSFSAWHGRLGLPEWRKNVEFGSDRKGICPKSLQCDSLRLFYFLKAGPIGATGNQSLTPRLPRFFAAQLI